MCLRRLSPIWTLRLWMLCGFLLVSFLLVFIAYTSAIQLRRERYLDYLAAAKDMHRSIVSTLQREPKRPEQIESEYFQTVLDSTVGQMSATSQIAVDITQGSSLVARLNLLPSDRKDWAENDGGVNILTSHLPRPLETFTITLFTDSIPLPVHAKVLGFQITLFTILIPCTFGALYYVGARSIRLTEERLQVAIVSHELRTPLTSLKMHLEMLQSGIFTNEADRTEYTNRSLSQVDRLIITVQGMLAASRAKESDESSLVDLPVEDVINLTKSIVDNLAAVFGIRIPVGANISAQPQGHLRIDREFLSSILANLIENAVKHGSGLSKGLTVNIRTVYDTIEIGVSDFGKGFHSEDRHVIFNPFRRGKHAHLYAPGGSGLGLAVVRTFVRKLGGSVRIDDISEGACVTVSLPVIYAQRLATA